MTENTIWFAVGSNKKPKNTRNIYNITSTEPLRGVDKQSIFYYDPKHASVKHTKWYEGTTFFKHIEALRDIANQFGEDLLFFGFSCRDCDFREEGSEKRTMNEWKTKR